MRTIYGLSIHFGLGYPREALPDGWTIIESPEDWALAEDARGRVYYLAEGRAYRRRKARRKIGRLNKGDFYADTENPVIFE